MFLLEQNRPSTQPFLKIISDLNLHRLISDCYDCRMNLSIPIMICDENEDIRLLLKEMLTRHGYFHLVEAHSSEEVLQLMTPEQFVLIHYNLINGKIKNMLSHRRNFLIISQSDAVEIINLAAIFGVKHIISFPYTSKGLVEKINELLF